MFYPSTPSSPLQNVNFMRRDIDLWLYTQCRIHHMAYRDPLQIIHKHILVQIKHQQNTIIYVPLRGMHFLRDNIL